MKKVKLNFIITGILLAVSLIFIVMVKTVDVVPLGPKGSLIGFGEFNALFRDLFGTNEFFYNLTDMLGKLSILVVLAFGCLGVYQLVKRKSIKKVDSSLLVLAVFYALMALTYVFFEIVVVNYRPVLIDGELEASFPSSHTMLVVCVMSTMMMQIHRLMKKSTLREIIDIVSVAVMIVAVIGRIISGVHWMTDIIGGLLISSVLIMFYYSSVKYMNFIKKDKA